MSDLFWLFSQECHGHFRTGKSKGSIDEGFVSTPDFLTLFCFHVGVASCIECGTQADSDRVKKTIVEEGTVPKCESCGGNVKPDIVFFGEDLVRHTLL